MNYKYQMDLMYIYHVPLVTQVEIWKPYHAIPTASVTLLEEMQRAPNVMLDITLLKGVLAKRVLLERIVGKMILLEI